MFFARDTTKLQGNIKSKYRWTTNLKRQYQPKESLNTKSIIREKSSC